MTALILHHYPASPFSEKIRRALAAGNSTLVVKLAQRYLEVHDQCYPH